MSQKIKYLSIGHCCHDKVGDGFILGGTTSYSSMLSASLGVDTSLLTSVGKDFLFEKDFLTKGISFNKVSSDQTTIFENVYDGHIRTQTISARANTLSSKDFSAIDKSFDVVHFSPIADEIDFDLLSQFGDDTMTLATPQGWLRQWDDEGKISFKQIDWSKLSQVDFVIISEEDVPDLKNQLSEIKNSVKTLIVTKGDGGSVVYSNKVEAHFPSYPSKVVDATGAGDTFATSFIIKYAETKEIVESMIFANCLASICVEHEGTKFFDHLSEVDQRIAFYKKNLLDLNSAAPIRVK